LCARKEEGMWHLEATGVIAPIVSIVFGILILIFPKVLNYLVALYFILVGIVGLLFVIM
jgi:hypothetical protein